MWITRDKDGTLKVFADKPEKLIEKGVWVPPAQDLRKRELGDKDCFPTVKWSNKEPTEICLYFRLKDDEDKSEYEIKFRTDYTTKERFVLGISLLSKVLG